MPATRFPWLILALSFTTAVRSQHGDAPRQTDAQLLQDLGSEERAIDAVRILARRGAPAVALLMAAIREPVFRDDPRLLATAIYTLGKLGDVAAPAATLLLDELDRSRDDVLRNIYWALGELGPSAQAKGEDVLTRLRKLKPTPGWSHQEWSFACRRIELGFEMSEDTLRSLLQMQDQASLMAVAGQLCRMAPGARIPGELLLETFTRMELQWRQYGEGHKRVALELARAVTRHAASTPEATAARAILIYHFDLDIRLEAVMQMGQLPGKEPAATVQALLQSLEDGSLQVRREAVTALAMIGPPAWRAAAALEKFCLDPDVQLRGRATAALRAIGRPGK